MQYLLKGLFRCPILQSYDYVSKTGKIKVLLPSHQLTSLDFTGLMVDPDEALTLLDVRDQMAIVAANYMSGYKTTAGNVWWP